MIEDTGANVEQGSRQLLWLTGIMMFKNPRMIISATSILQIQNNLATKSCPVIQFLAMQRQSLILV
jgi:hypothetical protein